jgi:hypothetical protein
MFEILDPAGITYTLLEDAGSTKTLRRRFAILGTELAIQMPTAAALALGATMIDNRLFTLNESEGCPFKQ